MPLLSSFPFVQKMNGSDQIENASKRKVFQVGEITRRIKDSLEGEFGEVWIEGEISNFKRPASGHCYFTLKDAQAQISAVLFKGSQSGIGFEIKDGMRVRVQGTITVYESRGNYQILVRAVEEAGKGALLEQFEKLKQKLAAEGLFDEARKKPLPLLPQHIGVVTSATGAAIRDILHVLRRRFPNLHVVIAPVKVQGEGAAPMIARAIEYFNQRGDMDALIVGRGGGSLEDLWAFNEEVVARAVAASTIPVISAVGHEIDFTICDFVADRRAPTPSAGAEVVVGRKEEFETAFHTLQRRLARALEARVLTTRNRLTRAARSYVFREPHNLLKQHRQRLEAMQDAIQRSTRTTLQQRQQRIDELSLQLTHRTETAAANHRRELLRLAGNLRSFRPDTVLKHHRQQLQALQTGLGHRMESYTIRRRQDVRRVEAQLRALSPVSVLDRGYSITRLPDGRIVRRADEVAVGNTIVTRLSGGSIDSTITQTHSGEDHGQQTKKD